MERLATDAARIVEAAVVLARRHHHATAEPEHLLRVLATEPLAASVLKDLAIDGPRLAEQLDERLAALPISNLYRDGQIDDPAVSAELRLLLHRASANQHVAVLRPVTLEQLVFAACGWPSLASLLSSARGHSFTARAAMAHARMFALRRGDETVNVLHVLHVVADQPWMRSALADAGVDPLKLQQAVETWLDPWYGNNGTVAPDFEKIEERSLWLGPLLRRRRVAALFADGLGVPVEAVLRALDDQTLPGDEARGSVDVELQDDDLPTKPAAELDPSDS